MAHASTPSALLEVRDLHVQFTTHGGVVRAVRGVSFDVHAGRTLAIVGESGCGKSATVQTLLGLIPIPPGRITGGTARLRGHGNILGGPTGRGKNVRGTRIGMVSQDPMSALNPTMTVGDQIAEMLLVHRGYRHRPAWQRAVELLGRTGIREPEERARQYPMAFAGGMLQRAMIAMMLAAEPDLLIADEPTTALDVTIQLRILDLLSDLQREQGLAIILVTHDLGVVARMADEVVVMYAGQIVETGTVDDIFSRAAHPYTVGLQAATPSRLANAGQALTPIPGSPPDLLAPPAGCGYLARCPHAMRICETRAPGRFTIGDSQTALCWLHHDECARRIPAVHYAARRSTSHDQNSNH